jgi:hypothetical protein
LTVGITTCVSDIRPGAVDVRVIVILGVSVAFEVGLKDGVCVMLGVNRNVAFEVGLKSSVGDGWMVFAGTGDDVGVTVIDCSITAVDVAFCFEGINNSVGDDRAVLVGTGVVSAGINVTDGLTVTVDVASCSDDDGNVDEGITIV